MSDDHLDSTLMAEDSSGADRRGFLTGLGAAACASLLASADSSLMAQVPLGGPKATGPKKKVSPTSGVGGIK